MGENCSQSMSVYSRLSLNHIIDNVIIIIISSLVGIETSSPLIKPSFISLPTTDALSVDFGEPLTLPCQADGNPIPTYEWYKDGVLIPGATRSSLHIQEVLPDDRGNYSCRATNSEGAILSGSTHVSIPGIKCASNSIIYEYLRRGRDFCSGVQQYEGVLECNMSINISEEVNFNNLVV